MTKVEDARNEIIKALDDMAPQHEGFRDFLSLNIAEDAREGVRAALVAYDRRRGLLLEAQKTLDALLADGYAALPLNEVAQTAYAELKENIRTMQAALEQFTAPGIPVLALKASAPEAKR